MVNKRQLVILANRLPVRRVGRGGKGGWRLSPGGLVSALTPIISERNGSWLGWAGTSGRAPAPFQFEGFRVHPVSLSQRNIKEFYYGFSNRTLWPLYHDAVQKPEYHRAWWASYQQVNWRFAKSAASIITKNSLVWVHDYHLQLVPSMLRSLRKDLRIGFFLHVPFPPSELFAQLPWRREILQGMLGSDVVGFQTRGGARNFALLARRFAGATGKVGELRFNGRDVKLDAFPVSVNVGWLEKMANSESVHKTTARLQKKLGDRKVILGVDRMDYTKGIDIRLRAFQELLERGEVSADECVLVQTAVPSRERVSTYSDLKERVEMLVGHINSEFGDVGRSAVHYFHRNLPPEELVAFYRLADVMLVTPLRDGMNLIAKEYVVTRTDDTGVLVLSEFTGSALELKTALLVNPHDIDGLSATLRRAIQMPQGEMRRRMRRLREVVRSHDVFDWGNKFLRALEE